MMNWLKKLAKKILRYPANLLIASSTNLTWYLMQSADSLIASSKNLPWFVMQSMESPTFRFDQNFNKIKLSSSIAARFIPIAETDTTWKIYKNQSYDRYDPIDGFPIPPASLWADYGKSPEEYVDSGREHFDGMKKVLQEAGYQFADHQRILDFGCAAGRMIRCLATYAPEGEIWGVDQSAPHVLWCQQAFGLPFHFITSTTFPHLAFEDNYFDLVYAGSVFTHIGDLEDAWLMELRRITKPGGYLYLTIADSHTMEILRTSPPGHWLHDSRIRRQLMEFEEQSKGEGQEYQLIVIEREPGNSQVFHNTNYIREFWGRYMEILSITPEAYGYQTAVTLRKRVNN